MKRITLILSFFIAMTALSAKEPQQLFVEIETSLGKLKIMLYNETPAHRDNFVKLVEDKFYEGTLFHRVIKEFMIQAGDPESKNATPSTRLGAGDIGYRVDAEIVFPKYYHKRGALAAARQADMVNPERKSSGCQFYIVEGRTFSDDELDMLERRVQQTIGDNSFRYSDDQRLAYKTVGGTPHLDGQYTVFGELVDGFDTLTKIANVATGSADRPKEDIVIISAKVVKR